MKFFGRCKKHLNLDEIVLLLYFICAIRGSGTNWPLSGGRFCFLTDRRLGKKFFSIKFSASQKDFSSRVMST